jgi:hypothetical protein
MSRRKWRIEIPTASAAPLTDKAIVWLVSSIRSAPLHGPDFRMMI